jgi:hypothetical protein
MCPRVAAHSVGGICTASLESAAMNVRIAHSYRQPTHPREHPGARDAVHPRIAARCAAIICVLALAGATAARSAHASAPAERSGGDVDTCSRVPARVSCPQSDEPMPGAPTSPFDFLVLVGVLRIPGLGPLEDALQKNRCASPAAAAESGNCPQLAQSPGIGGGHRAMTMI